MAFIAAKVEATWGNVSSERSAFGGHRVAVGVLFLTNPTIEPIHCFVPKALLVRPGFFGVRGGAIQAGRSSVWSRTRRFFGGLAPSSVTHFGIKAERLLVCVVALDRLMCDQWESCLLGPGQLWPAPGCVPSFVGLPHGGCGLKGLVGLLSLLLWQYWFGALTFVCREVCVCCGDEPVHLCRWNGLFGFTSALGLGFRGPVLKWLVGCVKDFPVEGHWHILKQIFVLLHRLFPAFPGLHRMGDIIWSVVGDAFNRLRF